MSKRVRALKKFAKMSTSDTWTLVNQFHNILSECRDVKTIDFYELVLAYQEDKCNG